MISKLFEKANIPKNSRKRFIPFVNERNFMGALLSDQTKTLNKHLKNSEKEGMAMI